jgi:hypothetical protein
LQDDRPIRKVANVIVIVVTVFLDNPAVAFLKKVDEVVGYRRFLRRDRDGIKPKFA